MSGRPSFFIHNALPFLFVSAGCHTPSELGSDNSKPRPRSDNAKQSSWHISIAYKGALGVVPSLVHAKALADQVARLASAGRDLGELALKYSDDPAVFDGNLGKIIRDQLNKPFTDAAFALMKMETGNRSGAQGGGCQIIRRTE